MSAINECIVPVSALHAENRLSIYEVMTMSMQPSVKIVLSNRPRLFRELLQHALNTASAQFDVVEAADAMPSPSVLRDASWLIVDEESAADAAKVAATSPGLGILALDGRGSSARVLTSANGGSWQLLSNAPTLSQLFDVLAKEPSQQAN